MQSILSQAPAIATRFMILACLSTAACSEPTGPSGGSGGPDGSGSESLGPAVTAGMFDIGNEGTACGVTVAGRSFCWGLYTASTSAAAIGSTPVAMADARVFASVSTATRNACALTLDGTAYCWGMNNFGQLGTGTATAAASPTPQLVSGGLKFARVKVLEDYVIGLTTSGKLYGWGRNDFQALGDGTATHRPAPVAIAAATTFLAFDVHSGYAVAIATNGAAWKWGTGWPIYEGLPASATPTLLAAASAQQFASVDLGYLSILFLKSTGEAYALGLNPATGTDLFVLTRMAPSLTFTRVATSGFAQMGLTSTGQLYAWGSNTWGQLGDGTTTTRSLPVAIGGALRFREIAAQQQFSAALTTAGELYFWGRNELGIFGNGAANGTATTPFSATPLGPRARSLSVIVTPASPTLAAGETLDMNVAVTRIGGGFTTTGVNIGTPGTVTISVQNLPSGVKAAFPAGSTIAPTASSTTIRLTGSSSLSGGVGAFAISTQAANMPTQPSQSMSVLKVSATGSTGLSLVCTSSATPTSFPSGYHCMTNSSGAHVPGKFAVATLTSSAWWVEETSGVCVSWRVESGVGRSTGRSTARFKGSLGGATTVTQGYWGLISRSSGVLEGVAGGRYLFTSNLDAQTQLLTFNDLSTSNIIGGYSFSPSGSCPW